MNYQSLFIQYLKAEKIKYTTTDSAVRVAYDCENTTVETYTFFKDDNHVCIRSGVILSSTKRKKPKIIFALNKINKNFRWTKFWIDDDNDVMAQIDAIVDENSCGEELFSLVRKMVDIIDDAYPDIVEADK